MDVRHVKPNLKVVQSTKDEKDEFYTLNPWKITPNEFLIRVAKYVMPKKDHMAPLILTEYVRMSKDIHNETNFKNFKSIEAVLISEVKLACKMPQ